MAKVPDASALLEQGGLRPTEIRRRVLGTLMGAGGSLSHRELALRLAGLDRVSIYRSLKSLRQAGLVHGVQGIDGVGRYVVNPAGGGGCPGGHPHFLCQGCGSLACLADQELPRVSVPRGSEVRGKQLLAYGLCPSCARASRRGASE